MVSVVSLTEHIGATVSMQTEVFLRSLVLGALVGVLYDFFRVLRKCCLKTKWIVAVQDIIFFTLFTLMNFLFMLTYTQGQVRWYYLVGQLFGWALYFCSVGVLVMRVSDFIISCVIYVIHLLMRLTLLLWIPLVNFINFAKKQVIGSFFNVKKALKHKKTP